MHALAAVSSIVKLDNTPQLHQAQVRSSDVLRMLWGPWQPMSSWATHPNRSRPRCAHSSTLFFIIFALLPDHLLQPYALAVEPIRWGAQANTFLGERVGGGLGFSQGGCAWSSGGDIYQGRAPLGSMHDQGRVIRCRSSSRHYSLVAFQRWAWRLARSEAW